MPYGKSLRTLSFAAATILSWQVLPAAAQMSDHPDNEKLKVSCDLGFAPFCFKTASGEITGFSYDLATEVAKKLKRPGVEAIDSNFSAIFAGLFSKRYEMIVAPTTVTEERAAQMLFSEPYLPTGLGFLTKKGEAVANLEALKGKAIAVNNGSTSDKWLTGNEAQYGFTVQRYNKAADGVQAVMVGRAFALLADAPAARYITTQNAGTDVPYVISTGGNFAFAFRKEDTEFRARVERALECMKAEGTLTKLHKKWFGSEPAPDSSTVKVMAGTGAPGFAGYDATEVKADCK